MFNHDLILHSFESTDQYDSSGNQIVNEINNSILCKEQSIKRIDFYSAREAGLKINAIVLVNPDDYEGQEKATYKGKSVTVLRTYPVIEDGIELLELTLVDRIGD